MLDSVIGYVVGVVGGMIIFLVGMWAERRRARQQLMGGASRHSSNPEALEIEQHILSTQKAAALLGIRVHACSGTYLALSAPLKLNTNVHGTAFAGSLYSLTVLTCYYAARSWLLQQQSNLLQEYILVAKSASIQYKRPVVDVSVTVARCTLPSPEILEKFRQELTGPLKKGYLQVEGHVHLEDGNVACTCTVELCAYKPRS